MAQAVITLGCMCVEGGLRARCLEGFCSSPLVGSIIHLLQPSDWRLYFISPALKKMKAVQPRSMSYMQDIVTAFLYSPFYACVCAPWPETGFVLRSKSASLLSGQFYL